MGWFRNWNRPRKWAIGGSRLFRTAKTVASFSGVNVKSHVDAAVAKAQKAADAVRAKEKQRSDAMQKEIARLKAAEEARQKARRAKFTSDASALTIASVADRPGAIGGSPKDKRKFSTSKSIKPRKQGPLFNPGSPAGAYGGQPVV